MSEGYRPSRSPVIDPYAMLRKAVAELQGEPVNNQPLILNPAKQHDILVIKNRTKTPNEMETDKIMAEMSLTLGDLFFNPCAHAIMNFLNLRWVSDNS